MVQVEEAVRKAQEHLPDIFDSAAGKEMRLEGVELSDDTKFWTITFSYADPNSASEGVPAWKLRECKSVKLRLAVRIQATGGNAINFNQYRSVL